MKNNKGISMITLIVTIICIIIFLGIAYRIGSRYISESKEEEKIALTSILSDSVARRQNDKYAVASGENIYYTGYHLSSDDFEKLYDKFDKKDCMYEPGLWFVIDAKKAEDLGIVDADKYLIEDINNTYSEEDGYIAVVDYYTGEVQLIKYQDVDGVIGDIGNGSDVAGCEHTYTILTCLEPSVCTKCGLVSANALGHDFNLENPTCTEPKKCKRCGYIAEKELGHEYESALSYNDKGHFNKCIRYDECGAVGNFKEHKKTYYQVEGDEWIHEVVCTEVKCGWSNDSESCTVKIKPKDTLTHIEYCTVCKKEKEKEHDEKSYKYIDKKEHMVWCESCSSNLYKEEHVDFEKPYGICDRCDGVMDVSQAPNVEILIMENITPGEEGKYWAKYGDKIKITLETSVILGGKPTIKLQNVLINSKDIRQQDKTWIAEIDTSEYVFTDGIMNIEVDNLKSLWGVYTNEKYETTDGKYITYDSTKPTYIYAPEN